MRSFLSLVLVVALAAACGAPAKPAPAPAPDAAAAGAPEAPAVEDIAVAVSVPAADTASLTEDQWRERLTPEQFRILREKGTEREYSGEYVETKTKGTYACAGCDELLFVSDTKFDSHCGWPSFFEPASKDSIVEFEDTSLGMVRTEVTCGSRGGHLGHVFNDGPKPTGLRYCINSVSIKLKAEETSPAAD